MKVLYRSEFNIDLGVLNALHPFDGRKFGKVFDSIEGVAEIDGPIAPVLQEEIDAFVDPLLRRLIRGKRYVMEALEVPYIPLLPFELIDSRILSPMRWAVAATIQGALLALRGESCRNLSGGYHHASRRAAEGFCIYNDIGMAYDRLMSIGKLQSTDRVLIVDVDAHHGNGNADVFLQNRGVTLLDVYNEDIYPKSQYTRERVDIGVPLASGASGSEYLDKLDRALNLVNGEYRLAFVVAGTDVLATDSLGGMNLTIEDCVNRDSLIAARLQKLSIPSVFVAGGGYSEDSSRAMTASIRSAVQGNAQIDAHLPNRARPQRALIIDDDPALTLSLRDVLESEGYAVEAADGGEAGVIAFADASARGAPFEVVITDIAMPNVEGIEVAAAIRQLSADTPVIVLTGWGDKLSNIQGVAEQSKRVRRAPPEFSELRHVLKDLV